jgi:hypothetical protein
VKKERQLDWGLEASGSASGSGVSVCTEDDSLSSALVWEDAAGDAAAAEVPEGGAGAGAGAGASPGFAIIPFRAGLTEYAASIAASVAASAIMVPVAAIIFTSQKKTGILQWDSIISSYSPS